MKTPEMDSDGYPSELTLHTIQRWHYDDFDGLMRFVKSAWSYPDFWTEQNTFDEFQGDKEIIRYHISTGGWSGMNH